VQPWSWVEREYLPQPIRYQETLANQEASANQLSENIKQSGSRYYQPVTRVASTNQVSGNTSQSVIENISWSGVEESVSICLNQSGIRKYQPFGLQIISAGQSRSWVEREYLPQPIRYHEISTNQVADNISQSAVDFGGA
jgi:hypothetical protein